MKPGTFTQMYVQLVFAVRNRDAVLTKEIRSRVFEYMSGIIGKNGQNDHLRPEQKDHPLAGAN